MKGSIQRAVAAAAAVCLVAPLGVLAAAKALPPPHGAILEAVLVSPSSINPLAGDTVALHVSLARPATIGVQVVDRDGYVIRALPAIDGKAGKNTLTWDGRDDGGAIVPDEAWSFRVVADGGTDQFFPALTHPAMNGIEPLSFSRTTATLQYKLPAPSRVHIQAGTVTPGSGGSRSEEGPVLKTIADREPRAAGLIAEHWNGFDASGTVYVPDLPGFAVAIAATPLPEQSVITFGNEKRPFLDYAGHRRGKSLFPEQSQSMHHAGLDVFHDLAPQLTLLPAPAAGRSAGVWTIPARKLKLRLDAEGPTARTFAAEPGKIYVFVDTKLVATHDAKDAAEPLLASLPDDGEHRIVVNWRSDYGPVAVAVARVRIAPKSSGTE